MLLLILPAGWGQAGIFQWVNGLKRRAGMRPWCSWMLEPLNDFSRRHFVIDQCIISKFLENMLKWDELVKIITQSLDLFQLGQLTHTWPMEEKWNNKSSGRMVFFQFCRFQPVIYLYAWNYFPSFPLLGITPRPVRICMPHHHVFFQIVLYHLYNGRFYPFSLIVMSKPTQKCKHDRNDSYVRILKICLFQFSWELWRFGNGTIEWRLTTPIF